MAATAAAAADGGSYLVRLNDSDAAAAAEEEETLENYLLRTRGPKHLSLSIVVPITVIYVFIFVTGVVGNIAVCLVIVRNNFMHTATNYYLFSLAVSDLTLLLLGKRHKSAEKRFSGGNTFCTETCRARDRYIITIYNIRCII